jgi:hypothetical protein
MNYLKNEKNNNHITPSCVDEQHIFPVPEMELYEKVLQGKTPGGFLRVAHLWHCQSNRNCTIKH